MTWKRCFDLTLSLLSILALSPVALILAILIKLNSRGPVIYRQTRIGKNGRPFSILKFRTMRVDKPGAGQQITAAGDPRVTGVGRILRKSKLDELPQLVNVLRGEMSFVGPRPEVKRYVDLYTEEQRQVLTVRPGITGVCQVEFRDEERLLGEQPDPEAYYVATLMPYKLSLDLRYVRSRTLAYDLSLILRTFTALLSRHRQDAVPIVLLSSADGRAQIDGP